jgi:multiple sugar transport system permease protein
MTTTKRLRPFRWIRRAGMRGPLLGLLIVGFSLPLTWTALAALGLTPDNMAWPPTWSWPPTAVHFAEIGIAEPAFTKELTTSTALALLATCLTLTVSSLAAYALVRAVLRGKPFVVQSFLILASLPVMAYALPLADTVGHLHLGDTFLGVLLAQSAVYSPLAIYILFGYLSQVPAELEESVRLDGGSTLQVLRNAVLPLAAPGLAATGIIIFVLNWNLFLVPLMLTAVRIKTVPVAMSDFFTFERELDWPTGAAALTTSLVPLVALVALAHRLLERFRLPFSEPEATN